MRNYNVINSSNNITYKLKYKIKNINSVENNVWIEIALTVFPFCEHFSSLHQEQRDLSDVSFIAPD